MLSHSTRGRKHDQVIQTNAGAGTWHQSPAGGARHTSARAFAWHIGSACAALREEACIRCAVILRAPRTGTTVNSSVGAARDLIGDCRCPRARCFRRRFGRCTILGRDDISDDDPSHRPGAGERGEINPELARQFSARGEAECRRAGVCARPSDTALRAGWVAITAGVG